MQKTTQKLLHFFALLSKLFLTICFCLTLWATIPQLFGFTSTTVISESMHPTLKLADVIITKPTTPDKTETGKIALVNDNSPQKNLTLHRVQKIAENGELTLKGDANPTLDQPIPAENFKGNAILRIPHIGLPLVLYKNQDWTQLTLLSTLLVASGYLSTKTPKPKRKTSKN